ncbi:hypothetical protein [Streptomyces sp. Amel2xC10]|uniref:hypothetical protein n=1 Tax=Streptomyces sp. Amel2xC10 TaxID=1305826 RepID=UPI000A08A6E2|nr:hypothetical protein [Streptomyces sp. Amel2xC10]SMF36283.1 hypothetical protein SAMN02745830_03056 [Streptomyces sp. Amel2xC10]
MSLFEPMSRGSSEGVAEQRAHAQPYGAARRLRSRLLVVNAAVIASVSLVTFALDGLAATTVAGAYTLGMLLLSLQAGTMMVSALWYDHACRRQCDPHTDALHGAGAGRELS